MHSPRQELHESKQGLILKVQALKKELQDWRGHMDGQVKTYRTELSGLQQSLQGDIQGLRADLQQLQKRIRSQLGSSDELIAAIKQRGPPAVQQAVATSLEQQKPVLQQTAAQC
ncbi:hypothetical protein N2152v2_002822 [Parachlorella kessleri]